MRLMTAKKYVPPEKGNHVGCTNIGKAGRWNDYRGTIHYTEAVAIDMRC